MDKRILREFLKAGYTENSVFYETPEGVPQGGVITPILANMVLDGLEAALGEEFRVVRYCDDFVVLGKSKEALETHAIKAIHSFLEPRGVKLNLAKTQILTLEEGFNFLGFHFREYPDQARIKGTKRGILLVKPASENVKRLKRKIKEILSKAKSRPLYVIVNDLNLVLRGWSSYYRSVTATRVFSQIG